MPNLPVKIGLGIVCVLYEEKIPCLEKLGKLIYVKSMEDLNRFTAMFGSGTGFVYHILDGYMQAAKQLDLQYNKELQGEDLDYKSLVSLLFSGAIGLAENESEIKCL